MNTQFQVHRAFPREDRSLFIVSGIVLDGDLHAGMIASRPGDTEFKERVHGVEFANRTEGDPSTSEPALTFYYSSDAKLEKWRALDWEDQVLTLHWS